MKRATHARNLHVPLPADLHAALKAEALRSGAAATQLAREAIRELVERRQREALHREIATYAATVAGTAHDLDTEMETAAVDHLRETGQDDG